MKLHSTLLLIGLLGIAGTTATVADTSDTGMNESPEITDQVLLQRGLQIAEGKDVIIDRVELPPNTMLPRRWHPGEMFVYVMEGTVIVSPEGDSETTATTGNLLEIPYKQVYSARTADAGALLLIVRIHDANQPVRVMVD